MGNSFFKFRDFTIHQDRCAMKVCTDASLFGVWNRMFINDFDRVLDIGTGTGLLSLLIASSKNVAIDAIELNADAAAQALSNFAETKYAARIQIHETDIKKYAPSYTYDFIVSNPPFFENDLHSPDADSNGAKHSTTLSLEELMDCIKKLLTPHGKFSLLFPFHRKEELIRVAESIGFYPIAITDVQQTPSHSFFRTMILFGSENSQQSTYTSLAIQESGHYTEAFKSIMKDVYFKDLK